MISSDQLTRRNFLRRCCGQLAGITAVSTLADLRLISHALAQTPSFTDYKALICIFLNGGNDSGNLLVPALGPAYDSYVAARGGTFDLDPNLGGLGLLPADHTGTLPRVVPINVQGNSYGFDFGVHSACASVYNNGQPQDGVARLFNDGKAAFVCGVGPLVEPITKAQYKAGTRRRPPQLLSHNDQVFQWQTSVPDVITRTGWGGRMADRPYIFGSNNGSPISMSISLSGANSWEVGDIVHQYQITTSGAVAMTGASNVARTNAMRDILALGRVNLAEKDYKAVMDRALNNASLLSNALTAADAGQNGATNWTNSPIGIATRSGTGPLRNNNLAQQLNMVARIINARHAGLLNMRRQIFFVSIGGFDTHSSQRDAHANNLLKPLSDAVWSLYQTLETMSISNGVTGFTISDFGRTFKNNDIGLVAGSDHGWSGNHLVFGGGVNGGRLYGTYPQLVIGGPEDIPSNPPSGIWIPTTSTDEFGATIAKWFGVGNPDLNTIFPNLSRFAHPDLGFLG